MLYYHVIIIYTDKKGFQKAIVEFNRPEKEVKQRIARPYMNNEAEKKLA